MRKYADDGWEFCEPLLFVDTSGNYPLIRGKSSSNGNKLIKYFLKNKFKFISGKRKETDKA